MKRRGSRAELGRSDSCKKVLEVLISILLLCGETKLLAGQQDGDGDVMLLYKVVRAVEKATTFFGGDYASINVDGLFGIQLCQGSLTESLKDCSHPEFRCPVDLTNRLEAVVNKLSEMAAKALPHIEQQDPKYYALFIHTIDKPYIVQYIPERLDGYVSTPGLEGSYDEQRGDDCYSNLLGAFSDEDKTHPECTITADCWDYMTRGNTAAYYITHQLLYFIIAEKSGCLDKIEAYLHLVNATSAREIEKRLCGKIYSEAKDEYQNGNVDILKQDLFLEQSVLCGILGFQEFFSPNWISMVLRWQTAQGCFTLPSKLVEVQEELNEVADRQRQLLDLLYDEAKHIDESRTVYTRRHLLREKTMNGDCLAHKTGLAFGTLGTYIRHLINHLYSH